MTNAVIGLGSNIGDRIENLKKAVKAISLLPSTKLIGISDIYETTPVGKTDQRNFYNCNLLIDTNMSPMALLGACLGIESAMGRERIAAKGPRIIDLDLLLFEGVKSDSFELTLPHPRILQRAFVMIPLLDLYPSGRAPGLYFGPHLKELGNDGVVKTEFQLTINNC